MTRDDIIRMAQECQLIGMRPYLDGVYQASIERFAALVAAAEREKWEPIIAAVMREMPRSNKTDGNAPGHAHRIPGIWDADNGDIAGTECAWCKAWNVAQASIRARGES